MQTKESILHAALALFAREGYEAVSVSRIAGELGMVKSALYKHYKSKRAIFDSILARMEEMDRARAREYEMPQGDGAAAAEAYCSVPIEKIRAYSKAQFLHWTQEEFPAFFRKMLTVEQFRSREMGALYQKYLTAGPLAFMKEIFCKITGEAAAEQLALAFYGPIFVLYSLFDETQDAAAVTAQLEAHVLRFSERLQQELEKRTAAGDAKSGPTAEGLLQEK